MRKNKSAVLVLQHLGGDGEQTLLPGVRFSDSDSNTAQYGTQGIAAILLRGSANAISLQHLQMLTGLDGREIRRVIQRERQNGACICINNRDGYFLAASEAERDSCSRSMFARARAVEQTARAIASAEVDHE